MRRRPIGRARGWMARVVLAGGCTGLAAGACGDTDDEKLRAAALAEGCTLNSDCADQYVCMFERCHVQCEDDRDCPISLRCVLGTAGINVCQLPDETDCSKNSDCPGAQGCAEDKQCRDLCIEEDDCVPGQQCTDSGVCVSPDRDVLDALGNLITGNTGGGGTGGIGTGGGGNASATGGLGAGGGAGHAGGAAGEGGGSGEAGASGSSGAPGMGGAAGDPGSGGVAGSAGSAGTSGVGGDAGNGGASGMAGAGPLDETEPNDTRDDSNPLVIGHTTSGEMTASGDIDFYQFATPAGGNAGGYFEVSVTDVGPVILTVNLYSTTNNGLIHSADTTSIGASYFGYFEAASGAGYQLDVRRWNGSPNEVSPYSLRVDYVPIDDPYEPNQDRLSAAPIPLGEPIDAYFFAGLASSSVAGASYADWYAVELEPGPFTVSVTNVPLNIGLRGYAYDPSGATVGTEARAGASGADLTFERTAAVAGTHVIHIYTNGAPGPFAVAGNASSPSQLPDHYTRPYRLIVTQ